jgi:mycothiol synthase
MDDLEVVVVTALDRSEVDAVTALIDRATGEDGHGALSEHKRMELNHAAPPLADGGVDTHRFAAVLAWRGPGGLVGYAHVSAGPEPDHHAMEIVVDPADPGGPDVAGALLDTSMAWARSNGGGTLRLWVSSASDADDRRAAARQFTIERNLIQMRCPLPLPTGVREKAAATIKTRPFHPGLDEEAWLVTNNRAFASHPEQGHWQLATLLEREKEPWFDPEGFLLLEEDGRMAGSCWTKVHARTEPPMGEIYVISVDPDFHGRGWGRALTQAGLDWLAGQGLTMGMLYVDGDNRAATNLYRTMGFVDHHVDRAYLAQLGPD